MIGTTNGFGDMDGRLCNSTLYLSGGTSDSKRGLHSVGVCGTTSRYEYSINGSISARHEIIARARM